MSVDTDLYARLREDGVAAHQRIQQLEAENRELAERVEELETALYDATVELCYVQEPGCGCKERHLCASYRGKDLIEKGMELLGVKDLSAESLAQARAALAGKKELP